MKRRTRRCDLRKQNYWEEAIRRCKQAGQSVRDFCRAEGLHEAAFYWWRRELAKRHRTADAANPPQPDASHVTPATPPRRAVPPRRRAVSFLPVQVLERHTAEPGGGIEIVLGQERTVRVRAGFDRQTLADVLAVLEVRSC